MSYVLTDALKLLHPFMPFITEEIYCSLHPEEDTIMTSAWPVFDETLTDTEAEDVVGRAKDLIKAVRTLRTDMNVPPSRKAEMFIVSSDAAVRDVFSNNTKLYEGLASASEITVCADDSTLPKDSVTAVIPGATVYIPLSELVDMEKEKERLLKEKARLECELKRSASMLSNEKFLSKAPAAKVQAEKTSRSSIRI